MAYQEALRSVRAQPAADLRRLVLEVLRELRKEAYLDRWSLVQVLSDIRDPKAVAILREVIETPLPPERSSADDHKFTTTGREVIIRTTAVDGVARLAEDGSREAIGCLLDNVGHEDRTVRTACIVALSELGGEPAERLRERVAEEDRALLELRPVNIYDVPQPRAGEYVRDPGAHDAPPPAPPSSSG
ncbi:hypothetical protein [Actinopolymorpha pittospori]